MESDPRYDPVDGLWKGITVPPITREEALAAARALYRKFARKEDASARVFFRLRLPTKARRCWINLQGGLTLHRGWPRLVHDCSHRVFRWRHPGFRPHEAGHELLELEMAKFVLDESGWLQGSLKPAKPPKDDKTAKLNRVRAAIVRWSSKMRRAQTALRKLQRKERYLVKTT